MKLRAPVDTGLLLRCPNFTSLSAVAQRAVKEGLINLILDYADPNAGVDDEAYYSDLFDSVYDEDGEFAFKVDFSNEQERWNFITDPTTAMAMAQMETHLTLEKIMTLNADLLTAAYKEIDFSTIHINNTMRDFLFLSITGVRL